MADHAGAAGAVDDVERLPEVLFQQRCDDPRGGVGAAASAPTARSPSPGAPDRLERSRVSGQGPRWAATAADEAANARRVMMGMTFSPEGRP